MNFLPENIDQYASDHSQKEPALLQELFKETWQKALIPRMISGHYQGRVLSMISKLVSPKTILLQKDGVLHTIDHNEELYDFQRKYFDLSNFKNQIKQYVGEALDVLPDIKGPFDLVFIDADKANYSNYFKAVIDKMNPGGVILSDNVLWSGKVTEAPNEKDEDTKALIIYNQMMNQDSRIETVLLPIRDGLTISRVK